MSEPRIIKKYPNRRLYDTSRSKYITLEDIRRLVLDNVDFSVRDAKSDEDLTRNILLQIIMEQEEEGQPILTEQFLSQIIRFYGDALQGLTASFLQRSLAIWVEQQQRFRRRLAAAADPVAAMNAMAEATQRNLALWREMQGAFFGAANHSGGGEAPSAAVANAPSRQDGAQIQRTQARQAQAGKARARKARKGKPRH